MSRERRMEPRESVTLSLELPDGSWATTRDISPSGMYLRVPGERLMGGTVVFEMKLSEARMRFTAEGQIVRLERRDGCTGIAVRLLSHLLEPLD